MCFIDCCCISLDCVIFFGCLGVFIGNELFKGDKMNVYIILYIYLCV